MDAYMAECMGFIKEPGLSVDFPFTLNAGYSLMRA
jgi:hypothetical protein